MARPNTEAILHYNIIQQFLDQGIKSIFNLQLVGEHAHCGANPLESSGFSYDPQHFMDRGIFFYNFGWKDYGTPSSNPMLLDMVKVMAFALSEGKAAVHCHAGLGRTGLFIACYLVYSLRCRPNDAVRYVRHKRHGSIQSQAQIVCIQKFAQFLLPLFVVYPIQYSKRKPSKADKYRPSKAVDFTLNQYLAKQRKVAHGLEGRHLRYIPKILYVLCERMLQLCQVQTQSSSRRSLSFQLTQLEPFCKHFLASDRPSSLEEDSSPEEEPSDDYVLDSMLIAGLSGLLSPSSPDYNYDDEDFEPSEGSSSQEEELITENACFRELSSQKELRSIARTTKKTTSEVAEALLQDRLILHTRLGQFQKDLNTRASAWDRLNVEEDVSLLAGLLWNWLDELQEPVLNRTDLTFVVIRAENPAAVLHKLDRGTRFTTEYLVRFVSRLGLTTVSERRNLLRRLTASLCHQTLQLEPEGQRPLGKTWPRMRDGTATRVTTFIEGLYDAVTRHAETPLQNGVYNEEKDKSFHGINIMASAIAR
ncbi:protein tyrosine phosphatase domain-containing protein 1-like isoform X2 [Ornithodoros turicata]|uniref:protein tyrosine phosphatase domain-containing protein 1-like isoform X2 n=1 Tax=Ornithodoros turicata TaxID=34597 RepID=UPI0031388AFB